MFLRKVKDNIFSREEPSTRKKKDSESLSEDRLLEEVRTLLFEEYLPSSKKTMSDLDSIVEDVSAKLGVRRTNVIGSIRKLEEKEEILVVESNTLQSFSKYLLSPYSNRFWVALISTVVSLGLVFATSGFALYLRYFFGSLLVFFLPGYSIVRLLYARREEKEDKGANLIKIVALSVGLSLVMLPSILLVLNYTVIGITLVPIALSLSIITIVSLTLSLARECEQYKLRRLAIDSQS
jgi:hypothetical protein